MNKIYKKTVGSRITNEDAQIIGEYIDSHYPEGVKPDQLWMDAKQQDNPLHRYFEWDIQKAAELYWKDQAKLLIRSIVVVVDEGLEPRAFHSVVVKGGHEYVSLDKARRVPQLWEQVVQKALMEAQSWAARYRQYTQLKPIVDIIEQVSTQITRGVEKDVNNGKTGEETGIGM